MKVVCWTDYVKLDNAGMKYFQDEDIIHIKISDGPELESVELSPNITAELGEDGEIIGVEILQAGTFIRDGVLESDQAKLLRRGKAGS